MTIFPLMLIRAAGLPLCWLDELAAEWPSEDAPESDCAEAVQQSFDAALVSLDASPLRTAVYNARKDFFQRGKVPGARFERLLAEHNNLPDIAQLVENLNFLKKNRDAHEEFRKRYERALQTNWQALQEAAANETPRRALLFASHDLLDRLPVFCEKPVERFVKKDRQTALSLLQYLTRAAAKTSPLSRFTTVALWRPTSSSCSTPPVEQERENIFDSPTPSVAPNVALLPALYEVLLREPAFYRSLSLSLNPCVTWSEQRTWLYFDGEQESFQQMETNPVADWVVKTLLENERQLPFLDLLFQLKNEVKADPEQLQTLVFELIDFGLLEWDLPEKGLSPRWCSSLLDFLGFLKEQPPAVVEAAALLRWMRSAARTLSFQTIEDARETQRETARQARDFFERFGGTMPPIPPEQIFFEDVEKLVETEVSQTAIQALAGDLAACWRANKFNTPPLFRARLFSFAEKILGEGQSIDFLSFSKKYFEEQSLSVGAMGTHPGTARIQYHGKIGALFQIFKDETSEFRAVVNGLFPGGGKLFARWLHLFPTEVREALEKWNNAIPFPWQGWSNANFQPVISKKSLAVPDGRTGHLQGGRRILLGDLSVKHSGEGIQLIDNETGADVVLTDLGLEAPETRPPAMQVLWHLGVPYISLEALLPERRWAFGGEGWHFAERVEHGSLILARKAWRVDAARTAQWLSEKTEAGFFERARAEMSAMGVSRRFFGRFARQKPQYFDRDSPLSMLLFSKMLRQTQQSRVILTEMLPLPEQCVVQKNGLRAAEFVLEMEV